MKSYINIYSLVLFIALIGLMFSCSSLNVVNNNPHRMQHLVVRNYLYNMGLSRAVELFDMKGDDPVTSIHLADTESITVENHMQFDMNNNLLSVSKLTESDHIVNFAYDAKGRLTWIIPNREQFATLDYDRLKVVYKGGKPVQLQAMMTNDASKWSQNIYFNDVDEQYRFSKKAQNGTELFDAYYFREGRIVAEHHRNSTADNNIDSINYVYQNNKLIEKSGIFNKRTTLKTVFDELERPVESIVKISNTDSIAWIDKYFYQIDDRLPYKIETNSSLGWKEEAHFRWDR